MRTPDDFTAYVFQRAEVARHNIRVRRQRIAATCVALVLCVGSAAAAITSGRTANTGHSPAPAAYSIDAFDPNALLTAEDALVQVTIASVPRTADAAAQSSTQLEAAKALSAELAAIDWQPADAAAFDDQLTVTFHLLDGTSFSLHSGENGEVRLTCGDESTAYVQLPQSAEAALTSLLNAD